MTVECCEIADELPNPGLLLKTFRNLKEGDKKYKGEFD
jgi:hypothetical protein